MSKIREQMSGCMLNLLKGKGKAEWIYIYICMYVRKNEESFNKKGKIFHKKFIY